MPLEEAQQLIAEGNYLAEVDSYNLRENVDQVKRIDWCFRILEEGAYRNRKCFTTTTLSQTALWKTLQLARACGMPEKGEVIDPDEFLKKQLRIQVHHEEYEGQLRTQVSSFKPVHTN